MATAYSIDAQRLREVATYNPDTGLFYWKSSHGGRRADGKPAGAKTRAGYIRISLDGTDYLAHRLAWLYHYGAWPENVVDHINGDRADNRIQNLRDVPHWANLQNTQTISQNNNTGARGVTRLKNRYRAEIQVNGQRIHLGVFDTVEEAANSYINAKNSGVGFLHNR
jgi:hypothetical protein